MDLPPYYYIKAGQPSQCPYQEAPGSGVQWVRVLRVLKHPSVYVRAEQPGDYIYPFHHSEVTYMRMERIDYATVLQLQRENPDSRAIHPIYSSAQARSGYGSSLDSSGYSSMGFNSQPRFATTMGGGAAGQGYSRSSRDSYSTDGFESSVSRSDYDPTSSTRRLHAKSSFPTIPQSLPVLPYASQRTANALHAPQPLKPPHATVTRIHPAPQLNPYEDAGMRSDTYRGNYASHRPLTPPDSPPRRAPTRGSTITAGSAALEPKRSLRRAQHQHQHQHSDSDYLRMDAAPIPTYGGNVNRFDTQTPISNERDTRFASSYPDLPQQRSRYQASSPPPQQSSSFIRRLLTPSGSRETSPSDHDPFASRYTPPRNANASRSRAPLDSDLYNPPSRSKSQRVDKYHQQTQQQQHLQYQYQQQRDQRGREQNPSSVNSSSVRLGSNRERYPPLGPSADKQTSYFPKMTSKSGGAFRLDGYLTDDRAPKRDAGLGRSRTSKSHAADPAGKNAKGRGFWRKMVGLVA
ncbi:hypothetical protein BOTBODRAFT_51336 [Botryobasidium botryosum FD-172 SS1]|uniref:Uncharacterized protein n=1 Tax=Botryobasidium botryosum (strain FD-172 SS1) TaxID=930990 RepID=A0A067N879_BOTB1|nr:hypothetical protein BOTBODRAFT_51336 [Botryobasidium botryosum FD-172 SS1]